MRQRQEEKRQQEETNRVKERKRKREKYAEKVLWYREDSCVRDTARRALGSLLGNVETFYAKAALMSKPSCLCCWKSLGGSSLPEEGYYKISNA